MLYRILVVTNTYPTNSHPGDSPQIQDQVRALQARDIEVDVLYIDRYKGKWSYAKAACQIMRLSIQKRRYDFIHGYYGHSGLIARMQTRYPVVTTFLGSDLLHPRDRVIGKLAAKFADGVIVQSEEMKRISKREDAVILPFGVNPAFFSGDTALQARRDLGLDPDEKLVLFPWDPARTVKRYDIIEKAVSLAQQDFPKARLVTVYDQPHDIVAKYMAACDCLVLASEHEGSPMAIREAMASNLPVIAVDVGDVRQMIEGTKGCHIVTRDPVDIAHKLHVVFNNGYRTDGQDVVRAASAVWGAEQVIQLYKRILPWGNKQSN